MKAFIIFLTIFSITYGIKSPFEKSFENFQVGKLSQDSHPSTYCAICNLLSPVPCWECPDLDDLPLCDLVEEYEEYSGSTFELSDNMKAEFDAFRDSCSKGEDMYHVGDLAAAVNISVVDCVKCNLVVKLVKFFRDEILTIPTLQALEQILCLFIKNCTFDLLAALIQGILDSMYQLIGVDLLNCPDFEEFHKFCITGPF